jgi:hypothetical protein
MLTQRQAVTRWRTSWSAFTMPKARLTRLGLLFPERGGVMVTVLNSPSAHKSVAKPFAAEACHRSSRPGTARL